MQSIKVVCVGDGAVGKTSLLCTFATNQFPSSYEPTVFDNYNANMIVNEQNVNLQLWDTAGQEDYKQIRNLSYANTDVYIVTYSCISPASFKNVINNWIPEIRQFSSSKVPIVLVATKADCLDSPEMLEQLHSKGIQPIKEEQLQQLTKQTCATVGISCSAKTGHNLTQVFELVVKAYFQSKIPSSKGCCVIV